ncbi:MAG: acylphosphatase [Chloroflexi bacterium]|nr:acylphosphatase [Chloroflexota bacterium]
MNELAQAHVSIAGHVQGVFFRESARRLAESLGLTGWVRNLPDGRVEAVFEGGRDRIERALRWCQHGPPGAEVSEVLVEWRPYAGEFHDFQVRRGYS